jgi:uncharacterized membrane protein YvlD (DUF360 family)
MQARLVWDWRPTRLAVARRAALSYLGACLALAVATWTVPGLRIDSGAVLLLAGLLLLVLDNAVGVALDMLLVGMPIAVAEAAGIAVQVAAISALGLFLPGVHVGDITTAVWGALLLAVLNSLFAELGAVSDDDSYYSVLVRRLVAREFDRPADTVPGLLVVQMDGVSLPVLAGAMRAGRAPVLGALVRDGWASLHPWSAMLPPTTPASQAGILHGGNDGIPGFRWYEKASGRTLTANQPDDAAEMVRRISDGRGLLADDGAGIGNLVTGDAPRSYLTMASISEPRPADERRRLRGFFVATVNYIRLAVLMAGEVAKEAYQAERQRGRALEPQMHRGLRFAIERAAVNIALRTVSTALVIEEMYGGAPVIYADYTGYDVVAHHCGPERAEAIDALDGIDRAIGSLLKAARYTSRPYRLVVLSDHGQALGATFRQRYGEPVETVIAGLLPEGAAVSGTTGDGESAGTGRRVAAEFGRGRGPAALAARRLASSRRGTATARSGGAAARAAAGPDIVVASSGNLAHVYLTAIPGRAAARDVEARYPGLIAGLARHPGIGAVVTRTAHGHTRVEGPDGPESSPAGKRHDDPLAAYGPLAAEAIERLMAFDASGDIVLLGAIDAATGEVTGFEDLIGSHGGLGGWQADPFILVPDGLALSGRPLTGAPSIFRELSAWRRLSSPGVDA